MRNTAQYPITLDEMIAAVERAYAEECVKTRQPNYPIGGVHCSALLEASQRLKRLQFAAAPTHNPDRKTGRARVKAP